MASELWPVPPPVSPPPPTLLPLREGETCAPTLVSQETEAIRFWPFPDLEERVMQ